MSDVLEAPQVRSWRAGEGPRPKVMVYEPGRRPMLRLPTTGGWQTCPAIARFDYPGGRVAYQV